MFDALEAPVVRAALDRLRENDAVARLHARDAALFAHPDVAANRLGWLDVATPPEGWPQRLATFAEEVARDGLDRIVLCGMGGSSLAPEVFAKVFAGGGRGASLHVLDSTHPVAVTRVLDDNDLSRTLVIVSSKSGTTEETRAFGAHAAALLDDPQRLVAITDPGSALAEQAQAEGWRESFLNPADIGGRYSALSFVGMVPAVLAGVDVEAVWARAAAMRAACETADPGDNPGAQLAAFAAGHAGAGRDKLTLLAPTALTPLGDWVEQLVAESTGKQGVGIVPVVGEPIGPAEVYGRDRAFVALRLGGERLLGVDELAAAGHPVLELALDDRADLGAEFVRWEVATALAGVLLGVDPFDEPNVTESKENTLAVLGDVGALPEPEHGDVAGLLGSLHPGDYLSIQAYLPPDDAHAAPLQRLRGVARDRLRVATTFGWGPRFLHSTGQLHKGGPNTVVALQVVDAPTGGPAIPGRPYDFATLVRAQALGDLRSLRAHDRRVTQVGVDGLADLEAVVEAVVGAPLWT
jgi:transaldolase/glucose-6-phosphate isomerase